MSSRWTFHDPAGSLADYSFFCNPTGDSPTYAKNISYNVVPVPGTLPIVFEQQDQPTGFSATGSILSQVQYEAFLQWYNLRHSFLLTDDKGYSRTIYITNFSPVRVQSRLYPWKHTYTLSGYQFGDVFP